MMMVQGVEKINPTRGLAASRPRQICRGRRYGGCEEKSHGQRAYRLPIETMPPCNKGVPCREKPRKSWRRSCSYVDLAPAWLTAPPPPPAAPRAGHCLPGLGQAWAPSCFDAPSTPTSCDSHPLSSSPALPPLATALPSGPGGHCGAGRGGLPSRTVEHGRRNRRPCLCLIKTRRGRVCAASPAPPQA